MTLRLAGFGVRGDIGGGMTPRVALDFTGAFAAFTQGGRILLARDTRGSGPMLHAAALAALLDAGCEVIDLGVCPTPILQFFVPRYRAAGGISISGGHNGMGWNSITLVGADGSLLDPGAGEAVLDCFHGGRHRHRSWDGQGIHRPVSGFAATYFDWLASFLRADAIRERRFKVLVDPVAGAGCAYLEPFAERLGLSLVTINGAPSAYLPREPEPRPRSALQIASFIGHVRGDAGFVFSSDLGRLSLVTETGEPVSEENTLPLIASHLLGRRAGPMVVNCCTTRTMDDLAAEHGVPLIRTRVGQAWVVAALADEQGRVGGEGNGSAAVPAFSPAFDGFLMMGLVLEAMAESGLTLSERLRPLRRYVRVKTSLPAGPNGPESLEPFRAAMPRADRVDRTDGLRLDWDDGWVHVRASRTEDIIRVISEARTQDTARARADQALGVLERML